MRRVSAALAGLALVAPAGAPAAPAVPPDGAVVANGPVRAITVGGGRVYFGGDFTRVGAFVGSNLRLDWTSGELRPGFARTNGQVSDVLSDGHGGWYLGGGFDWVEGVRRTNLVHVKADGSVDRSFNARVEGFVSALALDGNRLYVGGTLTEVDGRKRDGLALVDAATGRLDTSFDYPGSLPVPELALSDSRLYLQEFASFEGPGPVRAVDPFSGAILGDFSFPFEPRKVGALATDGGTLYVGGGAGHYQGSEFGELGALVALDGRSGAPRGSFAPGGGRLEGTVEDLELDGGRLVVGGDFERVGSFASEGVALLDAGSGAADTSFQAGVSRRVADVAVADDLIHAAAGSEIVTLGPSGAPAGGGAPDLDGPVDAVATQGGVLYAGGRFRLAGAVPRDGLAAIGEKSGQLVREFRPALGPGPHAQLALAHGRLYVGDPRGHSAPLAAVSPATGDRLRGFAPKRTAPVYDFAVGPDLVYGAVGGRRRVVAFDANTGRRARSFRVRTPGYVTDLEFVNRRVFLAGNWSPPQGGRAVIALRRRSGRLVAGFDPRANGEVQSIASDGGRLFLAGPFTRVHGSPRRGGAAVALRGGGLDGNFRPRALPRRGGELAVDGGRLYARDTRDNGLQVLNAASGERRRKPRWTQFTAVAPTPRGAWFGAGLGKGRSATWFVAFRP